MASFVIHNIAGEKLLNLLEENYGIKLTQEQNDLFLMSNLIVDSSRVKFNGQLGDNLEEAKRIYRRKIQDEKVATHFRNNDDANLCIQVPNLEKFENKYSNLLNNELTAIGYLFHLYTDKVFFEDLFTKTFVTLDENNKPTIYDDKTKMILIKKNNSLCTVNDFWNGDNDKSIYNDYTLMNKILLDYYGSSFDKDRLLSNKHLFVNPGITEVDFSNIVSVIDKTELFIRDSYSVKNNNLNIFSEEDVISFINEVAFGFIERYLGYFMQFKNDSVYQKKMCK